MKILKSITFLTAAALILFASCTEKETSLGLELQDSTTLFSGVADTAYGVACTVFDDSLLTSGQSSVLIGCYSDPVFGTAEAVLFTQMVTPNDDGVEFDQYCLIDSVVLSLSISEIFPSSGSKGFHDLHFEVFRLDEPVLTDSAYYADDELPVSGDCYFNDVVRFAEADTMVLDMRLNENIFPMFANQSYSTSDDFKNAMKGLRIRLVNDGEPQMVTVNMAAAATRVTVYFTYNNGNDSIYRSYEFSIGQKASHFNQYRNNFIGPLALFNQSHSDSLDGRRYLYLSPMGGTNVKLSFEDFISQFSADHPYATIHYAELVLPLADIAPSCRPDLIAALKYYENGAVANIPDMYDAYTYSGYDGTYDAEKNCYRLRITQHLQKLVSSGKDFGTLLVLNGRRSSAAHTVLNGYAPNSSGNEPFRIHFVYSE